MLFFKSLYLIISSKLVKNSSQVMIMLLLLFSQNHKIMEHMLEMCVTFLYCQIISFKIQTTSIYPNDQRRKIIDVNVKIFGHLYF